MTAGTVLLGLLAGLLPSGVWARAVVVAASVEPAVATVAAFADSMDGFVGELQAAMAAAVMAAAINRNTFVIGFSWSL
jgi:hypothetical protein